LEGTELERLESNELEQKFYLSRSEIPGFLAEVEFTGDSKAHNFFNFVLQYFLEGFWSTTGHNGTTAITA
jgi:hypothetical protein